jgi:hypothetical protein
LAQIHQDFAHSKEAQTHTVAVNSASGFIDVEIGEGYQLAEAHLNIGYCYEKMGKKELLSV